MMRRTPSIVLLFALVLAVVLPLTPAAVAAGEEDGDVGLVLGRFEIDDDAIKPGDDDQPTIAGRRRGQASTQAALPGTQPDVVIVREPAPQPWAPIDVLRTWIGTLRGFIERSDTLR